MNPTPAPSTGSRDAAAALPYPLRVAAALSWRVLAISGMVVVLGYLVIILQQVVIPTLGGQPPGQRSPQVAGAGVARHDQYGDAAVGAGGGDVPGAERQPVLRP